MLRESRNRFDLFGGLGPPELPEGPLDALQVRLWRWQMRFFGYGPPYLMFLGIVEELGELEDATTPEDACDAVGDTTVFLCQLFTHNRLAISPLIEEVAAQQRSGRLRKAKTPLSAVSALSRLFLKHEQRVRGMGDPEVFRESLVEMASAVLLSAAWAAYPLSQEPLDDVFAKVAEQVMQRRGNMLPTERETR